ncbi:hypothetical protein ACA910_019687 [Epithemia clementina (nom. ined.)]
MSLRKQMAAPGASAPAQHHSLKDGGDNLTTSDQNQQQPPFLTLEETTTVTDTSTMLEHTDLTAPEDRAARKRALQSSQAAAQTTNEDEQPNEEDHDKDKNRKHLSVTSLKKRTSCTVKGVLSYTMFFVIFLIVWDAIFTPPEKRWIQPAHTDGFLLWVQQHPIQGLFAIMIVIAAAVVVLIPIGTPLTLGCGYIYKGAYGWRIGLTVATLVSMGGSALGAVTCFLLGRYLFRDQVRQWAKDKYPLFDAIDIAASEHGLRIMAMLYLTPILPLGPVSYMCGTTSMALSSFVIAKIASLPLMLLYCFIGASARTLISSGPKLQEGASASDEMKSIEENEVLIALGILLSFVMIAGITNYIRKELNKILERQGKHKPGEKNETSNINITSGGSSLQNINGASSSNLDDKNDDGIEMGHSARTTTRRRAA